MKEKFEQLLHMVERKRATDVHFTLMQHRLHVQVRGWNGLETVQNAAFDEGLFCYLKYISKNFVRSFCIFASPCCRRLKNRQRYCVC